MKAYPLALLTLLCAVTAAGADRVVLVAGGGDKAEGAKATESKLNMPFGVDFDAAGNLYFVEIDGHRVCRIDLQGILTRLAGTGNKGFAGDGGPATSAEFN